MTELKTNFNEEIGVLRKSCAKHVQRPNNQGTYYIAWNKTGTGKALQWMISEIRAIYKRVEKRESTYFICFGKHFCCFCPQKTIV